MVKYDDLATLTVSGISKIFYRATGLEITKTKFLGLLADDKTAVRSYIYIFMYSST